LILKRTGTGKRGTIEVKGLQRPVAVFELLAVIGDDALPRRELGAPAPIAGRL